MIRVGLRFDPRDAGLLTLLGERVKAGDLGGNASTFTSAAVAAATGEPLIAYCANAAEAHQLADGYTLYGVTRPAIDDIFAQGNT